MRYKNKKTKRSLGTWVGLCFGLVLVTTIIFGATIQQTHAQERSIISNAFPLFYPLEAGWGLIKQGASKAAEATGQVVLSMVSVLTGLAGLALNYAIVELVVGMGGLIAATGTGEVISNIWTIVRDFSNILFIFGLLFVGFQTILNIETINTKKTLAAIIVGALLINFSLFFTKIVIDISNVFAVQVYELFDIDRSQALTNGIAGSFFQSMGLNTLWGGAGNLGDLTTFEVTFGGNITFFFMAMIFLLVAAFVFLAGAILLIVRFAALVLLMMFSPIMFAGMVFPQTQKFARDLWQKLLGYSFFAPLYFFLLYISLLVLSGFSAHFSGGNLATVLGRGQADPAGAFPVVITFSIGAIFLIASLIIAKNLSVAGADKAIGYGRGMSRTLMNKGRGWTGRQTLGRGSAWGARANEKLEETKAGRVAKGFLSTASLGTFDEQSRRAVFKAGKESRYGGSYSYKEKADFKKKRENEIERREALQKAIKEGASDTATEEAKANLAKTVAGLSGSEIDNAGFSFVNKPHIAVNLSSKQIEHIEKSEEFNESQVAEIKKTRENELHRFIAEVPQEIDRRLKQKPGDIAKMPGSVLTNLSTKLPIGALNKMYIDDTIGKDQQATIRREIAEGFRNLPKTGRDEMQQHISDLHEWLEDNNVGKNFGK